MTISKNKVDVLVVGARCAGAATAMLLARRGLSVLAVDRSPYGSDTLSTHALMRPAIMQLHRWGLSDTLRRADTPAVRRTVFHYGDATVDVAIKPRHGVASLYAPRRSVLDRVLVDAAREAGAEVHHGLSVVGLSRRDDGAVGGAIVRDPTGRTTPIEAGLVVGADGIGSRVAHLVGARIYERSVHASATLYGYFPATDTDAYHWHYRQGVGAGSIPTNAGLACVFVGASPERLRRALRDDLGRGFLRLLAEAAPELAADLVSSRPEHPLRGFGGRAGYLRQSHGAGWALVGDAGYFKDPITAHGITDALRDAELLADAVVEGSEGAFSRYQRMRDELSIGLLRVTDAIASFRWTFPELQRMHRTLSEAMSHEAEVMATPGWSMSGGPPAVTKPFDDGSDAGSSARVA